MNWRAGTLGLVLVAAVAARTAEQGAPLEKSREELKALQKKTGTPGGDAAMAQLRDAMPVMQSPVPAAAPGETSPHKHSDAALQKKKDARKNWLLDGMDKLDKNTKNKSPGAQDDRTDSTSDREQTEASDPDQLLNVYSEQQKNDEARAAAKKSTGARADPLTPFLQGWLADSPVRGKFFDEHLKNPDAMAGNSGIVTPASAESNAPPSLFGPESSGLDSRNRPAGAAPAQGNPYLQGLELSALADAGARDRSPAAVPGFQAGGPALPGALPDPGPAVRIPDKKPPLPALSDDKKYFPQLKKF